MQTPIYNLFPYLQSAVREHGAKVVHDYYLRKRNEADEQDNEGESDYWESHRESLINYVSRRSSYINLLALFVGVCVAFISTGYVWLTQYDLGSSALVFFTVTVGLYVFIRLIHRALLYASTTCFLSALGVLGWESFVWLRDGLWPGMRVVDALALIGIRPASVSIEGWIGVLKILNLVNHWFVTSSLPGAAISMAVFLGILAIFAKRFDVPLKEDEGI